MLPRSTRSTRLSTALIVTLAALACTAGSAQAAASCPPGGDYTPGNKLCLKTTHSPDSDNPLTDFISQNSVVTYHVEVHNPGPATATKVVVRFELDRRDPPQPNVRRLTFVSPLPAGCTAPADAPAPNVVTCSLGSVKPGTITRSFNVRTPATAAFTSSVAGVSADARSSDKGNNPNDPTVEDFEDTPEPVEVRVVDGQSISSVPDGVMVTLDTNPIGLDADPFDVRTAKFRLRAVGFSSTALITDSVPDDNTFVCPQTLKCPGGGWTEAFIPGPDGLKDPFDPPGTMEVELRYDATTLPPGFSVSKYAMFHDADYNDPDTGELEQIDDLCAPNPRPPCLNGRPFFASDGDFVAKAFVTGNWRFR
jgi:hypothetical protein